jgi:hypothetical protein
LPAAAHHETRGLLVGSHGCWLRCSSRLSYLLGVGGGCQPLHEMSLAWLNQRAWLNPDKKLSSQWLCAPLQNMDVVILELVCEQNLPENNKAGFQQRLCISILHPCKDE